MAPPLRRTAHRAARLLLLSSLVVAAGFGRAHAAPSSRPQTPPTITQQPQSPTVTVGQAVALRVAASGSGTLAYQWSRNGVPIAGATATTYAIAVTQLSDNGAALSVVVRNGAGSTTSKPARLTVNAILSTGATATRLFGDRSPWNARPSRFTLGAATIPTSRYDPFVGTGAYSVAGAIASATDAAVTVVGTDASGVWVPDAEAYVAQVTIPHWPASVAPAAGSDGHADIIDVASNRIHSFWQLSQSNGQWRAAQYTWTPLDGSGWGTPAAYMQGSRATGVVPIAGVIRAVEIDDGQSLYRHALAMSLTHNGLAKSPTFVFPATSADGDAATANSGAIPEGTRVMLPASFDVSTIGDPKLQKIARTLQTYGAYVVDRNVGTPYVVYVENGSNFNLMPNGWDSGIAAQLDAIRAALRPIASVGEWVDATGAVFVPETSFELMSMRGAWSLAQGPVLGAFDTWQQAVVFPANGQRTVQTSWSSRTLPSIAASPPIAGRMHRLRVSASGGATLRLMLYTSGLMFDSGVLADGADVTFAWPSGNVSPNVTVTSGASGGGTVKGSVVALP